MSYIITNGTMYCHRTKTQAVEIVAEIGQATKFSSRETAMKLLTRATKKLGGYRIEEVSQGSAPAKSADAKTSDKNDARVSEKKELHQDQETSRESGGKGRSQKREKKTNTPQAFESAESVNAGKSRDENSEPEANAAETSEATEAKETVTENGASGNQGRNGSRGRSRNNRRSSRKNGSPSSKSDGAASMPSPDQPASQTQSSQAWPEEPQSSTRELILPPDEQNHVAMPVITITTTKVGQTGNGNPSKPASESAPKPGADEQDKKPGDKDDTPAAGADDAPAKAPGAASSEGSAEDNGQASSQPPAEETGEKKNGRSRSRRGSSSRKTQSEAEDKGPMAEDKGSKTENKSSRAEEKSPRSSSASSQSREGAAKTQRAPRTRSDAATRRRMFTQQERYLVYNRAEGKCSICGQFIPLQDYTIDHIVPLSKGGTNDLDNLQACCSFCNKAKDDSIGGEFYDRIERIFLYQAKLRYGKKQAKKLKKAIKAMEEEED